MDTDMMFKKISIYQQAMLDFTRVKSEYKTEYKTQTNFLEMYEIMIKLHQEDDENYNLLQQKIETVQKEIEYTQEKINQGEQEIESMREKIADLCSLMKSELIENCENKGLHGMLHRLLNFAN